MFKKFKDKLAEEVKSSPQRLHQFAQAAQAAVTSASSSISDITNNDLFSIGDNDSTNKGQTTQNNQSNIYSGTSLVKPDTMNVNLDSTPDFQVNTLPPENQRLRRLSNSSFSSDISFRLPSYESPSMYHLQSDMEVSASEAEEKSPFGGMVNLDRVTKEQLYAAYRRTQDRCKKYKTQYSDLARHYKLLERENAKARNVLVETQDKALRRISELREQCSLEQSAKAHLEQVLRTEIEEKNMKLEALNTKLNLLQLGNVVQKMEDKKETQAEQQQQNTESEHLINFESNKESSDLLTNEVTVLNNKLEKMEQLLNKYKESLKVTKDKNAQLTIEMKKLATELENKSKENDSLKATADSLNEAKNKIDELNESIEKLQNNNNSLEFSKNKELSILDMNLKNAQEEITNYKNKIEVLSKREEEYAISLAENKLSIHKELESKEAEIKALKISLTSTQNEIKSLENKITEYKTSIDGMEHEQSKLKNNLNELDLCKVKITEYQTQLEVITEKCKSLENCNSKLEEEYKCLQLQLKQESAEKLAMIDRNVYLENRNEQLLEENAKKNNNIKDLENMLNEDKEDHQNEYTDNSDEVIKLNEQLILWKTKCTNLESEIQDEKVELEKLQAEIEKLLQNYQHVQKQNQDMNITLEDLKTQNHLLESKLKNTEQLKNNYNKLKYKFVDLRNLLNNTSVEVKSLKSSSIDDLNTLNEHVNILMQYLKSAQDNNLEELEITKSKQKSLVNELHDKSQQYLNAVEELNKVKEDHKNLLSNMEQNNIKTQEEIETIKTQQHKTEYELNKIKKESKILEETINKAHQEKLVISEELSTTKQSNCELLNKLDSLEKEKRSLKDDYEKNIVLLKEQNNIKIQEKIETIKNIQRKTEYELNKTKDESKNLEETINKVHQEKKVIFDELSTTKKSNCELLNKLDSLEKEKRSLNDDYEKNIVILKEVENRLATLGESYEESLRIKQDYDEQTIYVHGLEKEIENLKKENLLLQVSSEKISKSLDDIEMEMTELKLSHLNIEKEKDYLNTVLEKLEENSNKSVEHKEIQSDSVDFLEPNKIIPLIQSEKNNLDENIEGIESLKYEIKSLLKTNKELSEKLIANEIIPAQRDAFNKSNSGNDLLNECELLKKENKRLQSDIEGLQIYMTKVSKENDELNNKIRELISIGENTTEKIGVLKDDTLSNKEKLENLLRENSLLVEENLELKDQIHSQTTERHEDILNRNTEKIEHKTKAEYEKLVESKSELENRLKDLEEMNYTVNSDMLIMQESNKKLKLSNEKLERKLDEALVSLRHLHSLQENTELEYLKNILFEYLTGSGSHSYTLAKVLAAVVKFDDKQTDIVLQKEKERQGVLRQLGII